MTYREKKKIQNFMEANGDVTNEDRKEEKQILEDGLNVKLY
jgi:hypothetical protein